MLVVVAWVDTRSFDCNFYNPKTNQNTTADIGCGDGKYLELRRYGFHPTAFALGCDRSVRLLACAARSQQQEQEGKEEEEGDRGREGGEPPVEVFACDVLQVCVGHVCVVYMCTGGEATALLGKRGSKPQPLTLNQAMNQQQVPFRDGAFDAALCVAVLHHLSTEAHRCVYIYEARIYMCV